MSRDLKAIHDLVEQAIEKDVFPGASLLVGHKDKIVCEKVYGWAQTQPTKRPLTKDHVFDIASLTKPMATATLFMLATQDNLCQLDQETSLPSLTLRHLLNHTSGLIDWKPFYLELKTNHPEWLTTPNGKNWLIEKVLEEPLNTPPGAQCLYSDLGYIVLGSILEKIYQMGLNELFEKKCAAPMGLKNTFYQNLQNKKVTDRSKFVATETCSWRQKTLVGEVMDDNAWAMGGVAGHAGLFSTAFDIWTWLQELKKSSQGLSALIQKQTFEQFTSMPHQRDQKTRFFTLGFDTPSLPSSAGQYFSAHSLGHLGYTGTSFWWDLNQDLTVILLTNRVHPSRSNESIKTFRPGLHELIFKTFIG